MISNGEIRRNVTQRIKTFRLKLFGYSFVYKIIIGMIISAISSCGLILTYLISVPIVMISEVSSDIIQNIANILTSFVSFIITNFVSFFLSMGVFVFSIGFIKEMLASIMNNRKDITPIDFFMLSVKDWKRMVKVYLRLFLKRLPGIIMIHLGLFVFILSITMENPNAVTISTALLGVFIILAGIIWEIAVYIMYQTINYDIIYDEKGLEPKELLVKARETIKGHVWQWTRMNYYYGIIVFIIMTAALTLFGIVGFGSLYLFDYAGGLGILIGISIITIMGIVLNIFIIAVTMAVYYFDAKNIINLDVLYKKIQAEKTMEYNPVPNENTYSM